LKIDFSFDKEESQLFPAVW